MAGFTLCVISNCAILEGFTVIAFEPTQFLWAVTFNPSFNINLCPCQWGIGGREDGKHQAIAAVPVGDEPKLSWDAAVGEKYTRGAGHCPEQVCFMCAIRQSDHMAAESAEKSNRY